MHLLTAFVILAFTYYYGDWRNWKKYHATMLFVATMNLVYLLITSEYYLWLFTSDLLNNQNLTTLIYTFVVLPSTTLLLLSNFPVKLSKQLQRILIWIVIYSIWEAFFLLPFNLITYDNGWNLTYSILFDLIMFPIIVIHYKRPLVAYLITFFVAVLIIWWFNIPL